eukprot:COSAG06_NODE_544_length_14458_cov_18.391671_18_plen_45_part_00
MPAEMVHSVHPEAMRVCKHLQGHVRWIATVHTIASLLSDLLAGQ